MSVLKRDSLARISLGEGFNVVTAPDGAGGLKTLSAELYPERSRLKRNIGQSADSCSNAGGRAGVAASGFSQGSPQQPKKISAATNTITAGRHSLPLRFMSHPSLPRLIFPP